MSIGEYIILFLAVLAGGSIAFYLQQVKARYLSLVLSFSGAYLLGIAMLHLMPIAFQGEVAYPGIWILLGFMVQLLLEQMSGGLEHGHIHPQQNASNAYVMQLMLGLCLHAFFEGLPLGNFENLQATSHAHLHTHLHSHSNRQLLIGIILHKAPAAFALAALLLASKLSRGVVVFCLVVFASMSPLGAALAAQLGDSGYITQALQEKIIAFVIGSFLHIATTILFETDGNSHHRIPWRKLLLLGLGLGLAIASIL